MNRRTFIKKSILATGFALASCGPFPSFKRKITGEIMGASFSVGHKLLHPNFDQPQEKVKTKVVIVGGGMSGLLAGLRLKSEGFTDFKILELENEVGGNARFGENAISAYPWGAHYTPLVEPEYESQLKLFSDLGIIEKMENGVPVYKDEFLCFPPQERLYVAGIWQESLIPELGLSQNERDEIKFFFDEMKQFEKARGEDGLWAFAIPLETSSQDKKYLGYDLMTMKQYLQSRGWNSKPLHWYVNYCCRDDYGSSYDQVSAWAGIHYFASRKNKSNQVLTWPEGLGFLVSKMRNQLKDHIQPGELVIDVENKDKKVFVQSFNTKTNQVVLLEAEAVIMATPVFVASKILREWKKSPPSFAKSFTYAPWVVSNLTLDSEPQSFGAPLSWDNVNYQGESLGYVDATHQHLASYSQKKVFTHYWPLSHTEPALARKEALSMTHEDWVKRICQDMERMHHGVTQKIEHIDVMVWGHGMVCPVPQFLWGKERKEARVNQDRIFFAHTDRSGISIFEEALYQGFQSADKVLKIL